MDNNDEILLSVKHLCQYFPMGAGSRLSDPPEHCGICIARPGNFGVAGPRILLMSTVSGDLSAASDGADYPPDARECHDQYNGRTCGI